jgi:hypothetical protein
MTEVRNTEPYAHYMGMDIGALHLELQNLEQKCAGQYSTLAEEDLTKVIAITRAIRKKAAAPQPSSGGAKRPRTTKPKASIDSLA